jgi:transcriptional regulator with XRE-family HTH domain
MATQKRTPSAVEALRRRYVEDDVEAQATLREERVNARVAQLIYEARRQAGLTQAELADLVDTTQSVISRLEQADYEGHSLTMLDRIAQAIHQRVHIEFAADEPRPSEEEITIRFVFREVVRNLRRYHGLTVDQLAKKLGISRNEVLAMERDPGYRPKPLLVYKLSQFYGIPQTRLAILAGAASNVSPDIRKQASRFAAKSESFAKLTSEERQTLDEFVKFLKAGG